ncbi:Uncharacterised protein [Yersinia pekkanenii]|uniref:Putative endonuclease SegE-like GIY-YIG domain-containing protein n=1 Tax=Yersinia pekkanenii TaxID=1288385 RepID=A0A0T9PT89_9GAMM|nr:hypothetical protein [Yersinia pekkanenii]CNH80571.1 Uncharacterised protein [Yersinia pekkanenii]
MDKTEWRMWGNEFRLEEVTDHAAFVYMIQFPDSGQYYIGVKQVYKGIRNIKDFDENSKQSNWRTYTSSSKSVNEYIGEGQPYRKSILYCYKTLQEASLCETALISIFGTRWDCLNKAIMVKNRLLKDNGEQLFIIRQLLEDLS